MTRLVIIESPFRGIDYEELEQNITYARAAMRDCLLRGEAPYASHLLYTQEGVLDDKIPSERELGILAGFEWRKCADATVVYIDRGIFEGMKRGIMHARGLGHLVEYRSLYGKPLPDTDPK